METPNSYPESPMESDDMVFPCKGCGEILEEGKAFELAGNRWHIECFRCNTCGTLLDSDANLLLLGDGSLICNNCTYSCSACGNKIEDLAILTGDQAFCASCFRCRNCKRKIENLRYARTSQGIFCMDCHESLMQRRRKKTRATRQPSSNNLNRNMPEKSLPALPMEDGPQRSYSAPATEMPTQETFDITNGASSRARPTRSRKESLREIKRDTSPGTREESRKDTLALPPGTYKDGQRLSMRSEQSDVSAAANPDDDFFIPMTLDPNTAPGPSPHSRNRLTQDSERDPASRPAAEHTQSSKDYFTTKGARLPSASSHRDALREHKTSSPRSGSTDRDRQPKSTTSPHIAYQEKGRQASSEAVESLRKWKEGMSNGASPPTGNGEARKPSDGFKLQEVPKSKKGSRSESKPDIAPDSATDAAGRLISPSNQLSAQSSPSSAEVFSSPRTSLETDGRPSRGDSLPSAPMKQALSRRSTDHHRSSPSTPNVPNMSSHNRDSSKSGLSVSEKYGVTTQVNGKTVSKASDASTPRSVFDPPNLPFKAIGRPGMGVSSSSEPFLATRTAPLPPSGGQKPAELPTTGLSTPGDPSRLEQPSSAGLPRYSAASDFNMDEDMARILRGEEGDVLRRAARNASRHGRSFSDRGSRASPTPRWRGQMNGSMEISSPTTASPESKEEAIKLRHQLRRAQQRIAELEAERSGLQERVSRSADIKQVNTELHEKRSTITVLDAQREMVVRELETMTDHLARAKDSQQPLDLSKLNSDMLRDFATALEELKANLTQQIEDLVRRRNDLTDEIANLIQMKDKGFQEYESLSTKNAQLAELNSQLVHNIQDLYKANRTHQQGHHAHHSHLPHPHLPHPFSHGNSFEATRSPGSAGSGGANGLGIYHAKDKLSDGSMDLRPVPSTADSGVSSSAPTLIADADADPTLTSPQVVNIRKAPPTKKPFNWRKGGQGLARNVTKGIRGAFVGGANEHSGNGKSLGGTEGGLPYSSLPAGGSPANGAGPMEIGAPTGVTRNTVEPGKGGFPFFAGGKGGAVRGSGMAGTPGSQLRGAVSGTNLAGDGVGGHVLFGSDLYARCEHERRVIPGIVSRCVEEVELRGMDAEGVYRKSGGAGQVNAVRAGFEKDPEFDISDPDLDIHAVTSALKQYLRRLPVPLITYDAYEPFIEAGKLQDLEKRVVAMRNAINDLPRPHRDCLEFLVFHLARVMTREGENLMTSLNLAVVFAPTIMRPADIQREVTDMMPQRQAVQAMLENYKGIFTSG